MSTYIEYNNADGSMILVELVEPSSKVVKASRDGINVIETGKRLSQAFASARGSIKELITEMNAMEIDEAEVKFGLKAVGEAGILAVGKIGGETNYEITLKWKKPEAKSKNKVKNE